jgi:hypothetical protein
MNSKVSAPTYIAAVLAVAVIISLRSPAAPGPAQPKCPPVLVKAAKWEELSELQHQAELLLEKKTDFKRGSFTPTVWISAGDPEELVKFDYGTGIGQRFWSVSFGCNGTPSFYEHGILGEGPRESHESAPRLYEKVRVK